MAANDLNFRSVRIGYAKEFTFSCSIASVLEFRYLVPEVRLLERRNRKNLTPNGKCYGEKNRKALETKLVGTWSY